MSSSSFALAPDSFAAVAGAADAAGALNVENALGVVDALDAASAPKVELSSDAAVTLGSVEILDAAAASAVSLVSELAGVSLIFVVSGIDLSADSAPPRFHA